MGAVVTLSIAFAGCASDKDGPAKAEDAATDQAFSSQSASEILGDAISAMRGVRAMRLGGSVPNDQGLTDFDLAVDSEGDCVGSFGMRGGRAQVIVVGGQKRFLKGDAKLWTAILDATRGPEMHALVGNRWVQPPKSVMDLGVACDLDAFLDGFLGGFDSKEAGGDTGDLEEIDGREAIPIIDTDDGDTVKAWVATGEPHYLLKIEIDGDEVSKLTFSDFDEPVNAEAPDAADVALTP